VAIANALQLEAARARPAHSRFNTTPCQVWSRWTYPLPYYTVFAADTSLYAVTLNFDPVTLTCDLWSWTFAAYRLWRDETLYQIWTQSNNPRGVIAILVFDFMTLNIDLHIALGGSEIIFTKFNLPQLIPVWIRPIAFFDADTLCHFDLGPLNLELFSTSGVMRWNSVQNLSEI